MLPVVVVVVVVLVVLVVGVVPVTGPLVVDVGVVDVGVVDVGVEGVAMVVAGRTAVLVGDGPAADPETVPVSVLLALGGVEEPVEDVPAPGWVADAVVPAPEAAPTFDEVPPIALGSAVVWVPPGTAERGDAVDVSSGSGSAPAPFAALGSGVVAGVVPVNETGEADGGGVAVEVPAPATGKAVPEAFVEVTAAGGVAGVPTGALTVVGAADWITGCGVLT